MNESPETPADQPYTSSKEARFWAKVVNQENVLKDPIPKLSPEERQQALIIDQVRAMTEFRLMGYDLSGQPIPWKEDYKHIKRLEKRLQVDPMELKRIFKKLRETPDQKEKDAIKASHKYVQQGFHANVNKFKAIERVRHDGWAIFAGIRSKTGEFHPLGCNYGLDNMPVDDQEFESLSLDTIGAAPDVIRRMNPNEIAMNWRTSIVPDIDASILRDLGIDVPLPKEEGADDVVSMRRMGTASALKFLILLLAQIREKNRMMFNIGTIEDATEGSEEELLNSASYFHNGEIFKVDYRVHRTRNYPIIRKLPGGGRDRIARIQWRVRGDDVDDALANLLKSGSSLIRKGWDPKKLEEIMYKQIYPQLEDDTANDRHI